MTLAARLAPRPDALFVIVMPAFDAAATIAEAISSVLSQTFAGWEIVVVDDGSTDGTGALAEDFAVRDDRVRVIHQANGGAGAARDAGIVASVAPYIVRLDADDVMLPRCLETYASFIAEHPDYDIYSCDGDVFGVGEWQGRYYAAESFGGTERFDGVTAFTLDEMLESNLILSPGAVCTREA